MNPTKDPKYTLVNVFKADHYRLKVMAAIHRKPMSTMVSEALDLYESYLKANTENGLNKST